MKINQVAEVKNHLLQRKNVHYTRAYKNLIQQKKYRSQRSQRSLSKLHQTCIASLLVLRNGDDMLIEFVYERDYSPLYISILIVF